MTFEENEHEVLRLEKRTRERVDRIKSYERDFYNKFKRHLFYGATILALSLGLAYGGHKLKNDYMKYGGLIAASMSAIPVSIIGMGNFLLRRNFREAIQELEQTTATAGATR